MFVLSHAILFLVSFVDQIKKVVLPPYYIGKTFGLSWKQNKMSFKKSIFQQDLAPAHTAKSTKSWLNDHGVGVLD